MPFCPSCRYEYEPDIKKCPDCEVDLVEVLPEETDHGPVYTKEHIDLVPIFEGERTTVRYLQEILGERGIASIIPIDERTGSSVYTGMGVLANYPLMVSNRDIERRRVEIEECLALVGEIPKSS